MEYAEGLTLDNYIKSKGQIKADERWKMFKQMLEALAYIHEKGVIHGNLCPGNIFITKYNSIKLWNFCIGATSSGGDNSPSNNALENNNEFYCAPECIKGKLLQDRSDIYSLGIILFEISYSLDTPGKRETALTGLRKYLEFPVDFLKVVKGGKRVKEVILKCLATKPKERLSAVDLLASDLIPKCIEEEEFNKFIRLVKNPKTMESQKLMSKLFVEGNTPEVEFTDDNPEMQPIVNESEDVNEKAIPIVIRKMTKIFQRHCAVRIEPSLLYPYNQCQSIFIGSKKNKVKVIDLRGEASKDINFPKLRVDVNGLPKNIEGIPCVKCIQYINPIPPQDSHVKFLDYQRLLLQTAYNLHIPWSRVFAQSHPNPIRPIRRYAFGSVLSYKEGGVDVEVHCCFDINLEGDCNIETAVQHEAQVIKVVDELFTEVYGKNKYMIHINSTHILDCILIACGVKSSVRPKLYKFIRSYKSSNKSSLTYQIMKAAMKKLNMGRSKQLADFLNVMADTPEDFEKKVIGIFPKIALSISWEYGIKKLKRLMTFCEGLKVNMEGVVINASLMPDKNLVYHSGLFFNVVSQPNIKSESIGGQILAVGGRFDNILQMYAMPQRPLFGVGVDISCEAMLKGYYEMKHNTKKRNGILISFHKMLKEGSKVQMKECVTIVGEIRRKGVAIQGDFFIDQNEEDWIKYCSKNDYEKFVSITCFKDNNQSVKRGEESNLMFGLTVVDIPTGRKESEIIKGGLNSVKDFFTKTNITSHHAY